MRLDGLSKEDRGEVADAFKGLYMFGLFFMFYSFGENSYDEEQLI